MRYFDRKNITPAYGFTLVESLVSITILLIAIIVPMTIASQGLQASFFAREQTTAVYLAQEGIETIELLRDENALYNVYSEDPTAWVLCLNNVLPDPEHPLYGDVDCQYESWEWYDNLPSSCKSEPGCNINVLRNNGGGFDFTDCSSAGACQIWQDENLSNGLYYTSDEGVGSLFERRIVVAVVEEEQEVRVTSSVSWRANLFGEIASTTLQTRIFNQYNVSEFSDPVQNTP